LEDKLNAALAHRPEPEKLVQEGILTGVFSLLILTFSFGRKTHLMHFVFCCVTEEETAALKAQ
jgi:hypothetical protein